MANKVKNKSHKGLSKVLKVPKSGSVKFQHANKLHQTTHRSNASRRERHQDVGLAKSDFKRIKDIIKK